MRLLLILFIVFVVGLTVFGKNPLREFQEEQRALMAKYGNDEITIRTNLYIEQQQQGSGLSGIFGGAAPENTSENIYDGMLHSQTPERQDNLNFNMNTGMGGQNMMAGQAPAQTIAPPSNELYEGDINIGVNRNSVNTVDPYAAKSKSAPPERINNYYPPVISDIAISSGDTAKNGYAGNNEEKVVLTGNESKLRSGQPILFDNLLVYTVDASGNRRRLPDGTYTLEDGSNITISDGKRRGED